MINNIYPLQPINNQKKLQVSSKQNRSDSKTDKIKREFVYNFKNVDKFYGSFLNGSQIGLLAPAPFIIALRVLKKEKYIPSDRNITLLCILSSIIGGFIGRAINLKFDLGDLFFGPDEPIINKK